MKNSIMWKPMGFVLMSGAVAIALSFSGCADSKGTTTGGGTTISPNEPNGEEQEPGYGKPDPCEHKEGAVSVWISPPQKADTLMQVEVEISSDDEMPSLTVNRVAFDQRTQLICTLGEGRCQALLLADSLAGVAIRTWLTDSKEALEHSGSIEMKVFQAKKCEPKPEPLE